MKRIIVTDQSGRIIATGPHHQDIPGLQGKFGFAPLKGQQVHEVELPDHVSKLEHIADLHKTHRVVVTGGSPKLTPR